MEKPQLIEKGAFADIWDLNDGTVFKAFRSVARSHGDIVDIRDHDLLTSVFCAKEISAYRNLKDVSGIKEYIPTFYGKENPYDILVDVDGIYVENAGFLLEKVSGKDSKIAHLSQSEKDLVEPVLWEISHCTEDLIVWDASCFFISENNFKIIDFALWESSSVYECYLYDHGVLNEEQKSYLLGLI